MVIAMSLDPLKILKDLVNVNTVNNPEENVKPTDELPKKIQSFLKSVGIDSEILERNGYYSILGVLGNGKPVIMYMAHFDTVPVNLKEWQYDPFKLTVKGNLAYGRGSIDDKGNVAAIMSMLSRIAQKKLNKTIIFAFTGDEEIGGRNGAAYVREVLIERGLKPDYLINGDGHGMEIIIRRRCSFKLTIKHRARKMKIRGKILNRRFEVKTPIYETRHSAYFMPGVDFHPMLAASYYLRLNPELKVAAIKGEFVKSNVIPSWVELTLIEEGEGQEYIVDEGLTQLLKAILPIARTPIKPEKYSDYGVSKMPNYYKLEGDSHVITFDIRAMTTNLEELEPFKTSIMENIPEAQFTIRGGTGYLYTDRKDPIVLKSIEALKELNVKPIISEMGGASDSRYYAPINVKCIDFGPNGGNIHGPNEYVEIDSLYKTADFYLKLAEKI